MSDENKYPSQLAERFQIRLPDGMRQILKDAAAENGRSMNSEIIVRLQESLEFQQYVAAHPVPPDEVIDEYFDRQASSEPLPVADAPKAVTAKSSIDDIAGVCWQMIARESKPLPRDKIEELEMLYLSIKEREAEDRRKFIQLAKDLLRSR